MSIRLDQIGETSPPELLILSTANRSTPTTSCMAYSSALLNDARLDLPFAKEGDHRGIDKMVGTHTEVG
jgi:hypothetical protein